MSLKTITTCPRKQSTHVPENNQHMSQKTINTCPRKQSTHVPENNQHMSQKTINTCPRKQSTRVPENSGRLIFLILIVEDILNYLQYEYFKMHDISSGNTMSATPAGHMDTCVLQC